MKSVLDKGVLAQIYININYLHFALIPMEIEILACFPKQDIFESGGGGSICFKRFEPGGALFKCHQNAR